MLSFSSVIATHMRMKKKHVILFELFLDNIKMATSKLNKKLYTDVTRLKLLDTNDAEPRFRVKQTPFDSSDDNQNQASGGQDDEYLITGQIFPNSDIYKERSYMIEIKLTKAYPHEPPQIRFITQIYHPNVDKDGKYQSNILLSYRNIIFRNIL